MARFAFGGKAQRLLLWPYRRPKWISSIGTMIEGGLPTSRGEHGRKLSPREQEVMSLTVLGLTNVQIATRLQITIHAVKFHLASIYRKLGVSNRTEAAVTYLASGYPQQPSA